MLGVTLLDEDGEETDETECLGRIESDDYEGLDEYAKDLANDILARVPVCKFPEVHVPELTRIGFSLESTPI